MSSIRITKYQALKDQLVGPVSSAERAQFERELAQELRALASTPPSPRQPRKGPARTAAK